MLSGGVKRIMESYPRIYLACHRRHVRDDATGRTLSTHLASILDHLHSELPLTVSDLARHLGVTESTMSIQASKLERAGYVRRSRDEKDRRRVHLLLTTAGRRLKEQNSVLDAELVAEMISILRSSESEAALKGLELLALAADTLMRKRNLRRRRTVR